MQGTREVSLEGYDSSLSQVPDPTVIHRILQSITAPAVDRR